MAGLRRLETEGAAEVKGQTLRALNATPGVLMGEQGAGAWTDLLVVAAFLFTGAVLSPGLGL